MRDFAAYLALIASILFVGFIVSGTGEAMDTCLKSNSYDTCATAFR